LPWFQSLIEKINHATDEVFIFSDVHCEPSDDDVNNAILYAWDKGINGIIGIGGGSCMDCAKCITAAISNDSSSIELFLRPETKKVHKKLPLILIPTTAGTGAEITRGAVIIDKKRKIKRGFGNGGYYADIALIDPDLGCTLSKHQIAASGLDALCHALESFLVNPKHPICKAWSYNALKLIWDNLPKMYAGNDSDSRENMFLGSLLATMSFSTGVGLTFSHHISDVLGGTYEIPHGYASFYTLPYTVKVFEEKGKNKTEFEMLGNIFGAADVATALDKLSITLNVPSFKEYFAPMSYSEIDAIFCRIIGNSYRASGLASDELLLILQNSFMLK
jgi:alcohol dehydrogenase class IV